MKKSIFLIILVIISFTIAGCSTSRQEKIGLLDMDKVLQNSKRAQQLQLELTNIGNELEAQYEKAEEELSVDEGEEELDKIYQEYLDNKQRLEDTLNQEINQVIGEITTEKEITIVLYSKSVYYGGTDITEELVNRIDEKYLKGGEDNNEK